MGVTLAQSAVLHTDSGPNAASMTIGHTAASSTPRKPPSTGSSEIASVRRRSSSNGQDLWMFGDHGCREGGGCSSGQRWRMVSRIAAVSELS